MNSNSENQEDATNTSPDTPYAELSAARDVVYAECRKMIDTQAQLQMQLEDCSGALQESELMRRDQEAELLEIQKKYAELFQKFSLEIAERQNIIRSMENNRALIVEINKHCTDLIEAIDAINVEKVQLANRIKHQTEGIGKLEELFINEKTLLETKVEQIKAEKEAMEIQISNERKMFKDEIAKFQKQLHETVMKNNEEKLSLLSKQEEFILNMTKERDNVLSENELLKNKNSHFESSLNDAVEKLKSSLSTINELKAKITSINNELLTLNDEKQKLLESLEKSHEIINDLKNERNEIITQFNSKATQQEQLMESMSKNTEQLQNSFTEYKKKTEIELQNEITLKEQYICEIEKINNEMAELKLSSNERIEILVKELTEAKSTIGHKDAVLEVLERKINQCNDQMEKSYNNEQIIKTLENDRENLKQKLEQIKISEENAVAQIKQLKEALAQKSSQSQKAKVRLPSPKQFMHMPTDSDSDSTASAFSQAKIERNYNAIMRGEPGSPINFNAKTKKQTASLPDTHYNSVTDFVTHRSNAALKRMPPPNTMMSRPKKSKTVVSKPPENIYSVESD